jgi:hypothetical protein
MSGVVPPFGLEIGMRVMIGREREFTAWQCELISEIGSERLALTLPSPGTGEGKN